MDSFRAYRIDQTNNKIVAGFCNICLDDLTAGEVVIKVSHSTINYKDALAATGTSKILRTYPLVGGIDLAGTIISSEDKRLELGDVVLVNGCGLSEKRLGSYLSSINRDDFIVCTKVGRYLTPEKNYFCERKQLYRIK